MPGPRPFTDTINALRWGTLNDDLTKELSALVKKCGDTGKVGELTLKIKLKPGSGGQIEVFDDTTPGAVMVFASVCNSLGTLGGYVEAARTQEVAR